MLTINYNNTDLSLKLEEYADPTVDITLLNGEYIWLGYYKPITNCYVEFRSPGMSLSTLTVENETSLGFTSVSNLIDRTDGLGKSGKISWENSTNQIQSTRFGQIRYWYRLSVDVSTGSREYVGINILFSNDSDLEEEFPGILNELPQGAVSFVNFHSSSRKEIVQELRKKYNASKKLLTQFDLLENEEVREASKYITLSKICEWLTQAVGDKWDVKHKNYASRGYGILASITLTIDSNDNGIADDAEKNVIQFVRIQRV